MLHVGLPCFAVHSMHLTCMRIPHVTRLLCGSGQSRSCIQNYKRFTYHHQRPQKARTRRMCSAATTSSFPAAETRPVQREDGSTEAFPSTAGVYAIYSADGQLQYIGISRKIAASVAGHAGAMPDLTHSVKYEEVAGATKEGLTAKWQEWVQAAVEQSGQVPPGNAKGNTDWSLRRSAPKPEIKLTPGKGLQDLTCSVEELVDQVVKTNKVVAFIKGTRTQPQCGFSFKVLSILNDIRVPYEVVNVLDEQYNPGLREAIKMYSEWPTIPQLYVGGEFVGGADIVEEMHSKGELKQMVS